MSRAKEIGPFTGNVKPARPGMYKRRTRKGNIVWSWFDGCWHKFSASYSKAKSKGMMGSRSKHQSLPWFGRTSRA
jgi:hypothetical protein